MRLADIDVESEYVERVVLILDCLQTSTNLRWIATIHVAFLSIAGKGGGARREEEGEREGGR